MICPLLAMPTILLAVNLPCQFEGSGLLMIARATRRLSAGHGERVEIDLLASAGISCQRLIEKESPKWTMEHHLKRILDGKIMT
jgi:hypothetical protein